MYQPSQWTSHLRQPSIDVWETKIEGPGQKNTSWVQFHQDGGRCEPVCIHRRCPSPSDICGRPRAKAARDGFHYVLEVSCLISCLESVLSVILLYSRHSSKARTSQFTFSVILT